MKAQRLWRLVVGLFLVASFGIAQSAETIIYLHNDPGGSPVAATDASGNVLWKESYTPYGERTVNSPASATGKGSNQLYFQGKKIEALNGGVSLAHHDRRYYDASLGRFLQPDPIHYVERNIHSFNRYAFANNNPYKYHDPTGRAGECQYSRNCGGLGGYDGTDRTLGVLTAQAIGLSPQSGEFFDTAFPGLVGAAVAKAFSLVRWGLTPKSASRELIELVAHELRWPELRHQADQRIATRFRGDEAMARGDIAFGIRAAYEDQWGDRSYYERYRREPHRPSSF